MLKDIMMVIISFIFSLGFFYGIMKKIKDLTQIRMGKNDETIVGKVVGKRVYLPTGDIHPVVLCNVKGVEVSYVYRYIYNENKYPMGKEVLLKISSVSGLPYDKKDMIKDIMFHVFFLFFFCMCWIAGLYVLMFLR